MAHRYKNWLIGTFVYVPLIMGTSLKDPVTSKRNIFQYDHTLEHTPHCILAQGHIHGCKPISIARTAHGALVCRRTSHSS